MFICQVSGKQSLPNEKSFRLVTKTRQKEYYGFRLNPETKTSENVLIATGFEIVEEKTVCEEIYNQWQSEKNALGN